VTPGPRGYRSFPSVASALLLSAVVLAACGGSSGSTDSAAVPAPTSPAASDSVSSNPSDSAVTTTNGAPAELKVRLGEIRSAVELVEQQLGGAQAFSEVNATQSEVNVFVVANGQDHAYVVRDGSVVYDEDLGAYAGKSFAASDIAFGPGVLDKVVATVKDSELVAFSITPGASGGVDYIATITAPNGEFRVLLGADGSVLATS